MRFFFYGTLLSGSENAVAQGIHALLQPVGPASVTGDLFAIQDPLGWFPALMPGKGEAHGWLYETRAHFTAEDLARMDAYEDCDPASPEASLYIRSPVVLAGGGEAEVYLWNRPLPEGSLPIACGDFRRWLDEQGFKQFTGLREA